MNERDRQSVWCSLFLTFNILHTNKCKDKYSFLIGQPWVNLSTVTVKWKRVQMITQHYTIQYKISLLFDCHHLLEISPFSVSFFLVHCVADYVVTKIRIDLHDERCTPFTQLTERWTLNAFAFRFMSWFKFLRHSRTDTILTLIRYLKLENDFVQHNHMLELE